MKKPESRAAVRRLVRSDAARAFEWLAPLATTVDVTPLGPACAVVTALDACVALGAGAEAAAALSEAAGALTRRLAAESDAALARVDPELLALAYDVGRRRARSGCTAELQTRIVRACTTATGDRPGRRNVVARIMRAGFGETPAPVAVDAVLLDDIVYGDPSAVAERCDRIAVAGLAEHADEHVAQPRDELGRALAGRAFVSLRHHRLELGTRIVRTLAVLSLEERTVDEALAFLRSQQRSDGSYGYIDPFAARDVAAEVLASLRLTTTTLALRTLAEVLYPGAGHRAGTGV